MKRHNDEQLDSALQKFLGSDKKLSNKYLLSQVKSFWKAEMGGVINKYTEKINLRNKTLYVELNSAALKNEMLMQKEAVIKMINDHIKKEVVTEVVIK